MSINLLPAKYRSTDWEFTILSMINQLPNYQVCINVFIGRRAGKLFFVFKPIKFHQTIF